MARLPSVFGMDDLVEDVFSPVDGHRNGVGPWNGNMDFPDDFVGHVLLDRHGDGLFHGNGDGLVDGHLDGHMDGDGVRDGHGHGLRNWDVVRDGHRNAVVLDDWHTLLHINVLGYQLRSV